MKKEEIVMGLYAMRLQGKNRVAQERNNTVDRAVELINQLDEPEQTDTNVGLSKPVIPQFVAEWFENDKRDMEIEDVFWQIESCEMVKLDVDRWITDNKNTFIRAWLDGYEVEKEPMWVVRYEGGYFSEEIKFGCGIDGDWVDEVSRAYHFTDKAKADAVALLIGGTVEEVTE
ncbi:DUF1642 domain-containing protein [Jeotgalibaca porci]|uniref:DUF1642 domain-containing protein n=1 Tax=Jeotgalibaca porci TaxID=1868793 RepID=UPI0035A1C47E